MRRRSVADKVLLGLAGVFLGGLGTAVLLHRVLPWIGIYYGVASLVALAVYRWDKYRAEKQQWRVPESTLHVLEVFGGWPGALIAQRLFRHKNRKLSFQVTFWLIVLVHLAIWGWLIWQRITSPAPVR